MVVDCVVAVGSVYANVGKVFEIVGVKCLQADAGFIEFFDRGKDRLACFQCSIDGVEVIVSSAAIEEIDLAVGLRVGVLFNEFHVGEFAERHFLSDAVYFFEIAMEKEARDEALERITNKTNRMHACMLAVER